MQRMFKLLMCCTLVMLLALSAGAQEQQQKKGKGKRKANAAQKAKKAQRPRQPKQLSAEQVAQMEQAMPKEAAAKPQKPRKVLVFSLAKGFVHDSIPVGAKALEMMGKKTGAWEATISDNLDMFLPENLNQFDAVIMNNTTGRFYFYPPTIKSQGDLDKLTPEQKKEAEEYAKKRQDALVAFVKGGKGLVGVHSACDCEYDTWPEYGEMMGGYFAGHPWHRVVPFKIDQPDNVLTKPFGGKGFELNDEMYVFKEQPYSREKLLVLVSLDTPKLPAPNTGSKVTRPDGDYAVSWVHKVGEGRVFYCSLGHEWSIFWNPAVLDHYLRGIQYALGDLQAPDDPKLNKK